MIIGRLIGFKFLTHLNTNTDFQNMQFEAITLKLLWDLKFGKNDRSSAKIWLKWDMGGLLLLKFETHINPW